MSRTLLQRARAHIVTTGGLLGSYQTRYYRWTDRDLNGSANIALFRMTGTSGPVNHEYQQNDISLILLRSRENVVQGDDDMLAVTRFLRQDYDGPDVVAYHPLTTHTGPVYLENDRATFELVIRCGVTDH